MGQESLRLRRHSCAADWESPSLLMPIPSLVDCRPSRLNTPRLRPGGLCSHDYATSQQRDFAFETTLASRTFAPRLVEWTQEDYAFHLVYLWLPNADFALARIRERVQLGGHDVPEETVRRRYQRGLVNFLGLYQSLATTWRFYDNSGDHPRLVARGEGTQRLVVADRELWPYIKEAYHV
jgi:predicted ABC-type ATPase